MRRNYFLMFWISALLNVKLIGMISTVFYVQRGLSYPEIFYTSIVWSIVNLVLELPSSYMADRWGRKTTIIFSLILATIASAINFFAFGFGWVALSIVMLAASFAAMSGTDEALIYDTGKELGESSDSLKSLGKYYSGQRVFKIFTPLIAAFIANGLTEWQFGILIHTDTWTTVVAIILAVLLIEPNHFMDMEKMEAGVMKDAIKFFKADSDMVKGMFSKTLIFISLFIVWRIQQEYFLALGFPLIIVGLFWSICQVLVFVGSRFVHKSKNIEQTEKMINNYNLSILIVQGAFTVAAFVFAMPLLLIFLNTIYQSIEAIRWPVYSHYYNQKSSSYNRATTLSLSNFVKSILDIPLLFIASLLVGVDIKWVFLLSLAITVLTFIFTRLKVVKTVY